MKIKALLSLLTVAILAAVPMAALKAQTMTTKYLNGKIVFNSNRDGDNEIYTMNPDGSNVTQLTYDTADAFAAAWSPDGTKIAFTMDVGGGNYEIHTMNADGTNLQRLTTAASYEDFPAWSPDGSKITYDSTSGGDYEVWIMNSDGSGKANLTNNSGYNYGATWSPDGTKIAFASQRIAPGNYEVYVMNADGSNQTRITNDPASDGYARWPYGGASKFLFTSNRDGEDEIYTMNLDGSDITDLTNNAYADYAAGWSPDGTKILYESEASGNLDLYIMNPDGSSPVNISNHAGRESIYASQAWLSLPYTVTTNDDGSSNSTISSDKDYSSADYSVINKETLTLDGKLGDVVVGSGGTLAGTGSASTITVQSGGKVGPGHSPGCLSSGNFTLSGAYQVELGGNDPCSGYDQLKVTGTVNLSGGTLEASLVNNFLPKAGQSFTIIDNDASDPVSGTFSSLAEGTTFTSVGVVYKISYTGGDGNDVVLTVLSVPASPNTGFAGSKSFLPALMLLILGASGYILRKRLDEK